MNEVSAVVADEQDSVAQSRPKIPIFPVLKRWLREPLLHFLLLGLTLFGIYSYMQRGRGGFESSKQIALSLGELQQMDVYFESQWHRQPTPAEFQAMVEDKVREEVLYREGLAMGLDKDDEIVKRRMAQKMQFLAEDVAAAHEPSTAELQAWFGKIATGSRSPAATASAIFIFLRTGAARMRERMLRKRWLESPASRKIRSWRPLSGTSLCFRITMATALLRR
jgi:hypothetical protein